MANNKWNSSKKNKQIAILIDPGKQNIASFDEYSKHINAANPDLILVGGSQNHEELHKYIAALKKHCPTPIYLFPGNSSQFSPTADGILLISLLSGRNSEFLIGQHVRSSIEINTSQMDVLPTAYILIDGGKQSAVQRISGTAPIASHDIETAVRTALAGQLLGFKMIYLEAGSGALNPVPSEIISAVRQQTQIPIIVGGGLRNLNQINDALKAGADIIVVGNFLENNIAEMANITNFVHSFTKI